MNWPEFILGFVKETAWPLIVLLIVLRFGRPIGTLISQATRLKYKDLQIDFGRELSEVTKQADAVLPEIQEVKKEFVAPIESKGEAEGKAEVNGVGEAIYSFNHLATVSPQSAVLMAWLGVEKALVKLAAHHGISNNSRNPSKLSRLLRQHGKIDRETYSIIEKLRNLRNEAAHSPDMDMNTGQAIEYKELVDRLSIKLSPQY